MTSSATHPAIGQRLLSARLQRGRTQSEIARGAGLAASHLSRIENGRIQPTFPTVLGIARALGVGLHELIDPATPDGGARGPCPVTARGRCLLDLIAPEADAEHYSPREVRLIRRFAAWLKQSNGDRVRAMEVLLDDLTAASTAGVPKG